MKRAGARALYPRRTRATTPLAPGQSMRPLYPLMYTHTHGGRRHRHVAIGRGRCIGGHGRAVRARAHTPACTRVAQTCRAIPGAKQDIDYSLLPFEWTHKRHCRSTVTASLRPRPGAFRSVHTCRR